MKQVNVRAAYNASLTSYELEIEGARRLLLAPAEDALPGNVELVVRFCVDNGIDFVLSRNKEAFSCRDASGKRKRLGRTGIPLYDEFKTIVFKGVDDTLREKAIFVHCRGDLKIDLERLTKCCKLIREPVIMPKNELSARFGMEFGIVNPFLIEMQGKSEALHVFDKSLLTYMTVYPGTMMTNAGEHTWGIEFDPLPLIGAVDQKIIAEVAYPDGEPRPLKAGIIPMAATG